MLDITTSARCSANCDELGEAVIICGIVYCGVVITSTGCEKEAWPLFLSPRF